MNKIPKLLTINDIDDLQLKEESIKKLKLELKNARDHIYDNVDFVYGVLRKSKRLEPVSKDEQETFLQNLGLTIENLISTVTGAIIIGEPRGGRDLLLSVILNLFHEIDFENHLPKKISNRIIYASNKVSRGMQHRYSINPIPAKIALRNLYDITYLRKDLQEYKVKMDITPKIIEKLKSDKIISTFGQNIVAEMITMFSPMGAFQ
jgi:hypothetical protein